MPKQKTTKIKCFSKTDNYPSGKEGREAIINLYMMSKLQFMRQYTLRVHK